jgi:hypothetical protein
MRTQLTSDNKNIFETFSEETHNDDLVRRDTHASRLSKGPAAMSHRTE